MPKAAANGVELEYQTWGDKGGTPLLMINGLGSQLISWPEALIDGLVARGFYVIAFDNRDTGLSTKFGDWGPADTKTAFAQARAKEPVSAPYKLEDMADDAAELLTALDIDKAVIVGNSNGGAIAQTMAIHRPEKVKTLVSIMATSARRGLPRPQGKVNDWLMSPKNPGGTRDGAMDEAVATSKIIGSPGFPRDEAAIRDRAAKLYDRSFYPEGNGRHLLASIASGDSRAGLLNTIKAPTLVIQGRDDPLVHLECAEDVHNCIAGSEMIVIDGMAHDFPAEAVPDIVAGIADFVAKQ